VSLKSRFSFKFDAERDRAALPLLWIFVTMNLILGIVFLSFGEYKYIDIPLMFFLNAAIMLRAALHVRRQVKEFDARKGLALPS
jgi:hypothetical protein